MPRQFLYFTLHRSFGSKLEDTDADAFAVGWDWKPSRKCGSAFCSMLQLATGQMESKLNPSLMQYEQTLRWSTREFRTTQDVFGFFATDNSELLQRKTMFCTGEELTLFCE